MAVIGSVIPFIVAKKTSRKTEIAIGQHITNVLLFLLINPFFIVPIVLLVGGDSNAQMYLPIGIFFWCSMIGIYIITINGYQNRLNKVVTLILIVGAIVVPYFLSFIWFQKLENNTEAPQITTSYRYIDDHQFTLWDTNLTPAELKTHWEEMEHTADGKTLNRFYLDEPVKTENQYRIWESQTPIGIAQRWIVHVDDTGTKAVQFYAHIPINTSTIIDWLN